MEEIKTLSPTDPNYPARLKEISNPPKILYYQGNLDQKGFLLSVIGSRDCSEENKRLLSQIIKDLGQNVIIVSGLARGIDAVAHNSTISSGKRTIAVLPSGIERIYPRENIPLAEDIIASKGLLLSEYPPQAKPTKFSFIQRNRIVAGMAEAVLVVEAKMKSGTMSTASFARRYGKKIYAIPGSEGCDYLISNGAVRLSKAKDICL
jgi:DNA processing protein